MADIQPFSRKLISNLEKVIVGKRDSIELIVVSLLCQGHVLIEDVPGVGKTMLARSLAKSLGCSFNRLQFTPDMLPSDVTGVVRGRIVWWSLAEINCSMGRKKTSSERGPVFAG
jgi:MoxR-like ATPase